MSFLASILPSVGKFGSSVMQDILAGKNVGQSLKSRGLETIRNLPVIGQLAEPLVEEVGKVLWEKGKPKTAKGRQRANLVNKLFGLRLTPAGRQRAKVASQLLTGKDVLEDLKTGDIKDVFYDAVKSAKTKKGKITGQDVTDILEIVDKMKSRKRKK